MADKYISTEVVISIIRNYDFKSPEFLDGWARRVRQTIQADLTDEINAVPPADVVARDCFNRILAENDTMREQLAAIGKKPGDSMEDVEIVKIGHWIEEDGVQICSECGEEHEWVDYRASVCDCCGARMKARLTDEQPV